MTQVYIQPQLTVRTGLVADQTAKHIQAMRQAVWLYLYLLAAVSPGTGERLINPVEVAKAMGLSEGTVRSWLGQLRKKGYLACRREGSHLWVRVLRWRPVQRPAVTSASSPETPAGNATNRLTVETLAQALGEPVDSPILNQLVTSYSAEAIRVALDEVLAVPEERIKKSRLSFLLYLLRKTK